LIRKAKAGFEIDEKKEKLDRWVCLTSPIPKGESCKIFLDGKRIAGITDWSIDVDRDSLVRFALDNEYSHISTVDHPSHLPIHSYQKGLEDGKSLGISDTLSEIRKRISRNLSHIHSDLKRIPKDETFLRTKHSGRKSAYKRILGMLDGMKAKEESE